MNFWLTLIQTIPLSSPAGQNDLAHQQVSPEQESPDQASIVLAEIPATSTSQATLGQLDPAGLGVGENILISVGIGIVAFVVFISLSIVLLKQVYVITPSNEAFVRTGGLMNKRKQVFLHGGCVVLPGFHELTRVPLREISIDVVRTDNLAVRTKDYLRADMRVTFYVCINQVEKDVLTAAARLSNRGQITPDNIKNALEKRADDAIRAAAKNKELAEIDSDKLGFAQEVLNLIEPDIKKVGLTLNNIAVSEIGESDSYDTNNFFDAQGVRLRTETIQRSIKQKIEVELGARVEIEQRELDAQKESLRIAKETEEAQLAQNLEVEAMRAQRAREIQEAKDREEAATQRNRILQNKAVEEEEIRKALSIQQSQNEANVELEDQKKKLRVAQTLQQQEAEMTEIARQKTIEEEQIRKTLSIQQSQNEADVALEEQKKKLKVAQTLQQQEAEMTEISRQKAIEEEQIRKQLSVRQSQITADIAIEEENKNLLVTTTRQQQEAELAEITRQKAIDANRLTAQVEVAEAERLARTAQEESAIVIAQKEQERLQAQAERAKAEEGIATAIDLERAQRQQQLVAIQAEQEAQKQRITDQNVVEIDVFRRRRQAEIAREAAELEAESIRTLADAERDRLLAEAQGKEALIDAENALSDANRTAQLIRDVWPRLADQLPEMVKALAPQPGVLGDSRIYSFPGANGGGGSAEDINKLLLSTSGLSLINALLDEGKLGQLAGQVRQLLRDQPGTIEAEKQED
jgi:uncharacterized membrane protein YqiK